MRSILQEALWFVRPALGRLSLACSGAALLAGCSIHPVQQQVTGIRTPDLVNYIRCETRLAIHDKAVELLEKYNGSPLVIAELQARRGLTWLPSTRARMRPDEQAIYDRYIKTGIAYDFTFDITEENQASAMADPIKLITNGTAGIGLSASSDFKRQNRRHFIVSETAQDLLQNEKIPCGPTDQSPNYAYPIAGKIGIYELISTFFDLNQITSLAKDESTSTVFADTLTFTTTLTGSASPHVIVAPTGNRWGLASPANLMAMGSRIDNHALIIGLSLDSPKPAAGRTAVAAVAPGYGARSALQRSKVPPSGTEQSALDAVVQARIDAYLDRANR